VGRWRDGGIVGVDVLGHGFQRLVDGLCVRGFGLPPANLNLRFPGLRSTNVSLKRWESGGTFRFIRAEFSRSRVVGTRDFVEGASSSEVSEWSSIGLLDCEEDDELGSTGGDFGDVRGDGGEMEEGSGVGEVDRVMKFERSGEGGLFRVVAVRGEFTAGELFEWKKFDFVGETGERGCGGGFASGGMEYVGGTLF
jgi:hypothetical protein